MRVSVHAFLAALTYFTRIRSPISIDSSRTEGAACFAPVIGWIVGAVAATAFAISHLVFPISVAVVISMAVSILVTGGLHEDGWMDFCDGFGGGSSREQTIRIMRDSHSGAFPILGAILVLLLKFTILSELASLLLLDEGSMLGVFAATLVAGHGSSRFAAVAYMVTHDYISGESPTKAESMAKRMSTSELLIAALGGVLPVVFLSALWSWMVLFALLPLVLVYFLMGRMFTRRLAGYTGDCLGAVQQLSELAFYFGLYAVMAD